MCTGSQFMYLDGPLAGKMVYTLQQSQAPPSTEFLSAMTPWFKNPNVYRNMKLDEVIDRAFEESAEELGMKGNMLMIANRLRQFDIDRADLDDMVEISTLGKLLVSEYEGNELQAPEWLTDTLTKLKSEISSRQRDNTVKALKEARARLTALKTAEEKKVDLNAQIAELEAKLAASK